SFEAYLVCLPHRVSRVFLAGIRIYHVHIFYASTFFKKIFNLDSPLPFFAYLLYIAPYIILNTIAYTNPNKSQASPILLHQEDTVETRIWLFIKLFSSI
ncbi:hypothetical protein, partial [Paenibacillus sp. MABNR03]|uniref:hypothetical protein n=1 Tax=Paenibacillus sp. MABNR03 TaxID=3142626 RepID=UPI003D2A3F04